MTTNASTALAGLARAASGKIKTLAEMGTDEIVAGLTDEQRAGLAAALVPSPAAASAADPEKDPNEHEPDGDPDDMCSSCKQPMKDGKCAKCADASASADAAHEGTPAYAAGFAAATARAVAVMGAEGFGGHIASASKLLGNAKLSADEITALLADAPATSAASDPEAAARAEMAAAIAETTNSNADATGAGAKPNPASASASVWDQAIASTGLKR